MWMRSVLVLATLVATTTAALAETPAGRYQIVTRHRWGCTLEVYPRLGQMAAARDPLAMMNLVDAEVKTGRCRYFPEGAVIDAEPWPGGYIKVRERGDFTFYLVPEGGLSEQRRLDK